MTSVTIKLAEAVRLMREVSRVTANDLRERDGLGCWANFPDIRRYQQVAGGQGKRGSAILVARADVRRWVAEQKARAEEASRPIQAAAPSINTFGNVIPELAALGGDGIIRSIMGAGRHRSRAKLKEAT